MARIMHLVTELTVGGAQSMLQKLLSTQSSDFESLVVTLADGGTLAPAITALGVPVYSLGLYRNLPNPLRILRLRSIARRFAPHLIQGWLYHGNLAANLAAWPVEPRPAVLWNIRQALEDVTVDRWLTRRVIRAGALLSRTPDTIIYNSSSGAQQHEAIGYHAARREIIPNGFDCLSFRPDEQARLRFRAELGVSSDALLIGLVARLHPVKGQDTFLVAAGLVARQCRETCFVLIGPGVNQDPMLQRIVAEQQLQGRVFPLGPRTDIPSITAGLDIACSASSNEGFSNSIGEAMACSIPCVVTDVGDSAHLVADTGVVVPPRDPAALARGIIGLLQMGADGRR